jgi:hypothetical protein
MIKETIARLLLFSKASFVRIKLIRLSSLPAKYIPNKAILNYVLYKLAKYRKQAKAQTFCWFCFKNFVFLTFILVRWVKNRKM